MNNSLIKKAEGISVNSDKLFTTDDEKVQTVFKIPAYQRPYVWKQKDWEKLFDDIGSNEPGYFVGAILCVDKEISEERDYSVCEVIDGQQRLTTLSLLLAATYSVLKNYSETDFVKNNPGWAKKISNKRDKLKNQLTVEAANNKFITRVIPQYDDNKDDYFNIIIQTVDIEPAEFSIPLQTNKIAKRQLHKAFEYFKKRIENYAVDEDGKNNIDRQIERISELSLKINSTVVVMIVTDSASNANMLFEALNNRGVPLTITDLIRNKLLGEIKNAANTQFKFDYYKDSWNKILGEGLFKSEGKEISGGEQERFFRQSYNAFRFSWIKDEATKKKFDVGKKANLYDFYSTMITADAEKTFNQIMESAKLYRQIQGDDAIGISKNLNKLYKDLNHINGSTSYTLLLYIVKNLDSLGLTNTDLENICRALIKFFVRRNVTNKPTYNKLDKIFIDFVEKIQDEKLKGKEICSKLTEKLKEEVGKDFENILRTEDAYDNIGNDNVYFILTKLAEAGLHEKSNIDFWKESDKRAPEAWNIEHILPQTVKGTTWEKVLVDWAEKNPGNGTVDEIHKNYLNKLGNLTLTQHNSEMGNKPFLEKLELPDDKGNCIGYKNELSHGSHALNKDIVDGKKIWTPNDIQVRTENLVARILKIFEW